MKCEKCVALVMIEGLLGLFDGQTWSTAETRRDVTYRYWYLSQSQTQAQSRPRTKHAVDVPSRMRQVQSEAGWDAVGLLRAHSCLYMRGVAGDRKSIRSQVKIPSGQTPLARCDLTGVPERPEPAGEREGTYMAAWRNSQLATRNSVVIAACRAWARQQAPRLSKSQMVTWLGASMTPTPDHAYLLFAIQYCSPKTPPIHSAYLTHSFPSRRYSLPYRSLPETLAGDGPTIRSVLHHEPLQSFLL